LEFAGCAEVDVGAEEKVDVEFVEGKEEFVVDVVEDAGVNEVDEFVVEVEDEGLDDTDDVDDVVVGWDEFTCGLVVEVEVVVDVEVEVGVGVEFEPEVGFIFDEDDWEHVGDVGDVESVDEEGVVVEVVVVPVPDVCA
jgi:hypothetical protein